MSILSINFYDNIEEDIPVEETFWNDYFHLLELLAMFLFPLITLIVMILIAIRINTQATSKDLKSLIRKRHGAYFVAYLVFLAFVDINIAVGGFGVYTQFEGALYVNIETCLSFSGLFLAIIRILEPYVWIEFKDQFICCKKSKK